MSIVTRIEELSKTRSRIYLDGQFAFALYRGELRRYHIAEGEEISEEAEKEIRTVLLPKRAKLRCMNLLKSREYTEKQLRDKLQQGCYPEEAAEEAVRYVKSFHYIDDERYAEQYITCHLSDKSRQRIRMDLLRKGIDRDMVDRKLEQWNGEAEREDEKAQIMRLLEKKHFHADMTQAERQKIFAFLMRRGFQAEDIRAAMKIT